MVGKSLSEFLLRNETCVVKLRIHLMIKDSTSDEYRTQPRNAKQPFVVKIFWKDINYL